MKKILLALVVLVGVAGCNSYKNALKYLESKCPDSSIVRQADGSYKISVHCTALYNTDKVKQYLPVGKVTYDVSEAELTIVGVSKDSIPQITAILQEIAKGIRK